MASREWLYTKIIGAVLGTMTLLSISVGGANLIVQLQDDVTYIKTDIKEHKIEDEKQWTKAWDDIEENTDDIHGLQIMDKELEIKYAEIMRRFDEVVDQMKTINLKLDNLERVD